MRHFSKYFILLFIQWFIGSSSYAQSIENTAVVHQIPQDRYIRFHYDNDLFVGTDYYYSQGISLEMVSPGLNRLPTNKLLIKPQGNKLKFGIEVDIFGYTPTSITAPGILYGDRPFAAAISIKSFVIAIDSVRRHHLSSAFTLGVLGPLALGDEIQTGIHKLTNNRIPKGWQNQVQNDVIINYQVRYEKQIFRLRDFLLLNGVGEVKAGTLNTGLGSGINFSLGKLRALNKSGSFYFFGSSQLNLIGYNATMQGGLFNRKNPYIIPAGDISRVTALSTVGIALNYHSLYFSAYVSRITKEFKGGRTHNWAGMNVGISF